MTRYEIEAISRQWHDGRITAEEMARRIKGPAAGLKFCKTFDHERWEGSAFAFYPDCNGPL